MPPPEAPPGPSVSVVVVVGGSCVLRYSRPPPPPPPAPPSPPPGWGRRRDPPEIRPRDGGDLLLLLRGLGPGAPPEPVAATSFVGPEPRDLLPADEELGSPSSAGRGPGLGWPQEPAPFWVELPRGPGGFGFSLQGGPAGVFVRGLREGGPAQRCGCIQVSDELLAINGAPTAGMSHAQALARIRGGGSRLRLLLRRPQGAPPNPAGRGVLRLRVGSSPRGEPCFCLVGGLHP
ncbi:PDZ domain-containing protein MAGIX isoform X2 [Chamaea fasciata]